MNNRPNNRPARQANAGTTIILTVVLVTLVVIGGIYALTIPEERTVGQKISDAASELSNGVDKAGRQLKDRTAGEKIGDAVKDAGQEIKDSTSR